MYGYVILELGVLPGEACEWKHGAVAYGKDF